MQPDNPLIRNFDLPEIAGEAIRAERAKTVTEQLDTLFETNSHPVALDGSLLNLYQPINELVGSKMYSATTTDMSEGYEVFDHEGVKLVSRIIRLKSEPGGSTFDSSTTYLIALMGEDQSTVSMDNCPIGVVVAGVANETLFFKIEKNEKLGELVVQTVVQDAESERVLMEQGHPDRRTLKVSPLSPEDRYAAVMEFETALSALGKEQ